ncbi:MAG: prepilin-type N-terminal cleavage/methylation domain-containing protein [Chthoniobacteraceae bacterium]
MRSRFDRHRLHWAASGFTIVELLVVTAVLALLVALLAQLMDSATRVTTLSRKHISADDHARLVFDRLARDFAGMIKRRDIDYYFNSVAGDNDEMAFYCVASGYFDSTSPPTRNQRNPVSLIAYRVHHTTTVPETCQLERLSKGMGWEPDAANTWLDLAYLPVTIVSGSNARWPNLFSTSTTDADFELLSEQVFRFEIFFLLKSGSVSVVPWDTTTTPPHTSIYGLRDVAAIGVTLGILDPESRVTVSRYESLISAFSDAVNGKEPAAQWNSTVKQSNFPTVAGIPSGFASAVRIYQRYFYLNVPLQ